MATFCATCGTQPSSRVLCEACGMDPRIPKEVVLAQTRLNHHAAGVDIEYPGETTVLAITILASLVLAGSLTLISLGLAAVFIFVALLRLQFSERQLRDRALPVSDASHPLIANMVRLAAFRLAVSVPDVHIVADAVPNAYTAGFLGRHWVVLTSKLVELTKPDELLFVIGHELGHIRREHVSWMVLTSPQGAILVAPIRFVLNLLFTQWKQRAEFAADRVGVLACRSADSAARALLRVTYWTIPDNSSQVERQVVEDPVFDLSEMFEHHPALARRLRQIRDFANVAGQRGQL